MKGVYTPTQAKIILPVRAKLGSLLYWNDKYALRVESRHETEAIQLLFVFDGNTANTESLTEDHCIQVDANPELLVDIKSQPKMLGDIQADQTGLLAVTDEGFAITFPDKQPSMRGNHSGIFLANSKQLPNLHLANCDARLFEHWRLLYRMPDGNLKVIFERSEDTESS